MSEPERPQRQGVHGAASPPERRSSYTARELEAETGFDRRTIAYYVQEGLLPRVGRRGPRTRYPRLVRDRLLFVRRVRDAEAAGAVSPVSLSRIRSLFEGMPAGLVASVADGGVAVTRQLLDSLPRGLRSPGRRRAALAERVQSPRGRAGDAPGAVHYAAPAAAPERPRDHRRDGGGRLPPEAQAVLPALQSVVRERRPGKPPVRDERTEDLGDALAEMQDRARARVARSRAPVDTWTRIRITPEIELSVRGIGDNERSLTERIRRAMRRALKG